MNIKNMYIFRFYLEKLAQLEKVSLTLSSDLWLRNDELTADFRILLITDPSIVSINSCGKESPTITSSLFLECMASLQSYEHRLI